MLQAVMPVSRTAILSESEGDSEPDHQESANSDADALNTTGDSRYDKTEESEPDDDHEVTETDADTRDLHRTVVVNGTKKSKPKKKKSKKKLQNGLHQTNGVYSSQKSSRTGTHTSTSHFTSKKSHMSNGTGGGNFTDSSQPSSNRSSHATHRSAVTEQTQLAEQQLSDKTKATRRIMSASRMKINDLRNQLSTLQREMGDLQAENKVLKRIEQRQMRALERFENAEDEIPQMLLQHHNEERALKELYRKSTERNQRNEATLRDKERQIDGLKHKIRKFEDAAKKKNLPEKEELAKKVEKLELELDDKDRKISDLERSLDLQLKRHKHELQAELAKSKQLNNKLKDIESTKDNLERRVVEKEKEMSVRAMYQNRVVKPPHKLQSSTPSPQGSGNKKRRDNSTARSDPLSNSFNSGGSVKKDELGSGFW